MNITANNVASKLFVGFVATAMLFMLATPAKAQTAAELQAQINALMAQIAALQGATTPSATTCTFTRSLTVGSQGEDVKCLQTALTPTYFNNAGGATGFFGPMTKAAVAAWQSANGVMPAVGYFGPISQAKFAMSAPAPTPTPTTPGSDDSSTGGSSASLSGEASLKDVTIDSASDDTIDEGQKDAEIGVATLTFQDGDAKVTRLDVTLDGKAKVWTVLDEVALMVDGKEIGRVSASSKSDYSNTSGNQGTLRFTGLNLVAKEDKDVEVSIVATVNGGVDTSDQGSYSVSVDSLRFVDGTDVTSTETGIGDLGTAVNFTIGAAGADDELIVKTSSADPVSTTFELKDDNKSGWETAFAFDLDTKDSPNDIELTTVDVTVVTTGTSSSATFNKFVDDYELVIDGVTIDKLVDMNTAAVAGNYTDGTTTVLRFDVDGDVTINAGDRVKAELRLKFKALNALDEGATVQAKVTGANADAIDATGGDDLIGSGTGDQITGSATGDVHTLRTMGIIGEANSMTSALTAGVSGGNDTVNYTMKVDVTAFNQDVYIAKNSATSVRYDKTNSSGTALGSTTNTAVDSFTSTADEDGTGAYFYVPEGSTETFTIVVKWSPGAPSAATGIQLLGLDYANTNAPENAAWEAAPAKDYRTDAKSTNL